MSNRRERRKQLRHSKNLANKANRIEQRRKENIVEDSNKLLFSLIQDISTEKETAETANEKWLTHCEKNGLKEHAKGLFMAAIEEIQA